MKNILLIAIVLLLGKYGLAQNISATEYFFDTDPGTGNGTSLTVDSNTGAITQTFSIPISGLSNGFHSFYVRSQTTNGEWSHYDRTVFFISSISEISQALTAAEYFFDTDPGIGSATTLTLNSNTGSIAQTFAISTSGLSEGFHSFYIRTRNSDGKWSLFDRGIFFINSFSNTDEAITSAEYFYDIDPGVGNGTPITLDTNANSISQSVLLPTDDLTEGVHTVFVRVRTQSGNWSLYDSKNFTISNTAIDNSVTLNNLTLTATFNSTDASYRWLDCSNGNTFIENAVNREFTPRISGNYAVEITLGSQTVISNCVEVVIPPNENDDDADGILDNTDNCPLTFNPNQTDSDNDGVGDVCDDDLDNDGIPDALDDCPNTPLGAIVDFNGCEIFSLPSNNFLVKAIGESCISNDNGSIEIITENPQNYTATLTGNSTNSSNNFSTTTVFTGLSAGDYTVCLTVEEQPNYERCFDLSITEPEALSVSSKTNLTKKEVTLALNGGSLYYIELNDNLYTTSDAQITLPLNAEINSLSVITNKGCQGVYKEQIILSPEVLIYPNPIENGPLSVFLGPIAVMNEVEVSIFSANGKLELAKVIDFTNGILRLDVSSLSSGIHFLNIKAGSSFLNYKIVKR